MPESSVSRGLVLSAPSSNSGKTLITLALLRALKNRGHRIAGAKSGPDYIDPRFHEAACGQTSFNLDGFAMEPDTLRHWAHNACHNADTLLIEGAMGLFDAAANGKGSTADVADTLDLPVILVVDCKGVGQSVAALASGFANYRPTTRIAGIILNKIGSDRHVELIRSALDKTGIPILGHIRTSTKLTLPSRHLGLVQAEELTALDAFLDEASELVTEHINLDALLKLAAPVAKGTSVPILSVPLGQTIAIARDKAFAFCYPHQLEAWRAAGTNLSFFSPLDDEGPDANADAVFLPGGYPELYAGRISHAENFRMAMEAARDRNALIYGECGGYMVLGNWLVCGEKHTHKMLGFLPLETSFAERKLQLGYRNLSPIEGALWNEPVLGHEFHYATTMATGDATPLFQAKDATGSNIGDMGMRKNRVMGSFAHLI